MNRPKIVKPSKKTLKELKVIQNNPQEVGRYRDFIAETEGNHGEGHSEKARESTRSSMSEKEVRKQNQAMKRLIEKGFFNN